MVQKEVKPQYNILTAICMIIGIVIGSGIFFKSDDILNYTGGNVMLGILVFVIAAIAIIFGGLAISQLAARTDKAGGVITYMEDAWSKPLSGALGWFHTLVYYPTLIVIVSWVAGVYICILFGIDATFELECMIGMIITMLIYLLNLYAAKAGNILQISTTIIKLIPLVLIAVLGFAMGESTNITSHAVIEGASSMGFLAAIVPIAFAFDGWIIATSMSHEIKNSKKNVPLALIAAPVFIVIVYSLYLAGISAVVGPDQVVALGNDHVDVAANKLFGTMGAKFVLVTVVVSVVGTVNGLVMGAIRMPYSLAVRNMCPKAIKVARIDGLLDVPFESGKISVIISMAWYIIHYLVMKYELLLGSDVSELAIVMNYICYIALYVAVIKLYKAGEIKNIFLGLISPIMAIVGSCIIFLGSAIAITDAGVGINYKALTFMAMSVVILIAAYKYCKSK